MVGTSKNSIQRAMSFSVFCDMPLPEPPPAKGILSDKPLRAVLANITNQSHLYEGKSTEKMAAKPDMMMTQNPLDLCESTSLKSDTDAAIHAMRTFLHDAVAEESNPTETPSDSPSAASPGIADVLRRNRALLTKILRHTLSTLVHSSLRL